MKKLTSNELRELYLEFFKSKGHTVISSASLIPENDPTVLFTTAGMHPLVPYLLGQKHPGGTRLTDVQKCVRTGDIDEVGDESHCTFFEMLGNWSLGDYFKQESIRFSYEFLTSEKYLGINPDKLVVSVFEGDDDCPRDEESAKIWEECGIPKERIFYLPKKNNWWGPAGITGPCGPDTEIFIDTGKEKCCEECSPACDCGKYLEIWNNVFMQYNKTADGKYEPLAQKNVDTGMGLERTIATLNGSNNVYETDAFSGAIKELETLSHKNYLQDEKTIKAFRIIVDHVRTATFILGDPKGVTPSNVDQGYVLRRLIRRAVRFGRDLDLQEGCLAKIASLFVDNYKHVYPELDENREKIVEEFNKEEERFAKTLISGTKEFEKVLQFTKGDTLNGKTAFRLYDTFGFPIEITVEMAKERGFKVDIEGFEAAFKEHQEKSHAGSEQKFKGGLADNKEATTRLHTAAHLMLAGLRKVCGDGVFQRGSNITAERLRFDFSLDHPMTPEEIKAVEDYVNEAIQAKADIEVTEMSLEDAKESGAMGIFTSKYGETVRVYRMGKYSYEICGGPHAKNTGELGHFKIIKEQSSSAGVRRIKAILE